MVRYEILIPLRYNDGTEVDGDKITDTRLELLERFQAISLETSAILGLWIHQGVSYEDELVRLFIDTEDSPEIEQFFRAYKETLKQRFGQVEIWIVAFPIRII